MGIKGSPSSPNAVMCPPRRSSGIRTGIQTHPAPHRPRRTLLPAASRPLRLTLAMLLIERTNPKSTPSPRTKRACPASQYELFLRGARDQIQTGDSLLIMLCIIIRSYSSLSNRSYSQPCGCSPLSVGNRYGGTRNPLLLQRLIGSSVTPLYAWMRVSER